MLVGGSMNTCSSMSPRRCENTHWIDPATMRITTYVALTTENLERLAAHESWSQHNELQRQLMRALRATARSNGTHLELSELSGRLRNGYPTLWRELDNAQWRLVRDILQKAEAPEQAEISRPELSVQPEGAALFETFARRIQAIAERQDQEARVLVVTASGMDSFDAVDFYLNTFRAFGIDAQWLPIDAALGAVLSNASFDDSDARTRACEQLDEVRAQVQGTHERARVYPWLAEQQQQVCKDPDTLLALIQSAQGMFINGGDQSLTRQAFIHTDGTPFPWLREIQRRVHAGTFIAGGTSAGTAVMTQAPMITNGTSLQALKEGAVAMPGPPPFDCERNDTCAPAQNADSLTYRAEGGIGLFPFGLLDTHFSERGRHGRFTVLQASTGTPMAVGVDETTALLVDTRSGDFQVQGAHGVVLLEQAGAEAEGFHARKSYLRHGSSGRFAENGALASLHFSPAAHPDTAFATPGRGELLRDRTLLGALNQCTGGSTTLFSGQHEGFVLQLNADALTSLAHIDGGCEWVHGLLLIAPQTP